MTKILYRDHRGGLKESLATTIEVDIIQDIIDHLNREWEVSLSSKVAEIKFEEYGGLDSRIGWFTWIVMYRNEKDTTFYPAGFSNGVPPIKILDV